ncbi:MAG: hypothetical protein A2654_01755 [Candidatus Nealsonbacteria bacterium RIFCSPHIGHO2_01_FULL_43_31]|uniref:SpoVT-AbrB domain-containing protein n=2 Tax=Candidatus Nealsoniibacteriota TaxID=1817911 RepID=A0A1G2E9W5_9BACT|nr:MAG: hypothetical protein A2654_01755 [Candidatus Nealsonbacteria bacterium RIFCSPHIGHO2_01_FULL_43_31]OGZ22050.1 MAG: hypothetical protein A3D46_03245 [Candidatus Nealsonbacteria bacterium RIFCSPHIGHO2_02_FULL_43_13]OGZ24919.1 MAG: hypothetical protein A2922_01695 [Candidatus Nealsonbacteria bacterium RIFCSPLOWO2_01_FULL_43_36]
MPNQIIARTIEPTVKIGPKHQITIPAEVFKKLQLKEGDFLGARVKDAQIVLKPKRLIARDQEWFWAKEWQSKEREADEDIRAGRVSGPFANVKDLIVHLDGLKKKRP